MMILETTGNLKETSKLRIKRISEINEPKYIKKLIREYEDVFRGMENIKKPKTGKVVEIRFEREAGIQQIPQKPRHVPYHQKSPLKKWIDQREADGIFEKVPRN